MGTAGDTRYQRNRWFRDLPDSWLNPAITRFSHRERQRALQGKIAPGVEPSGYQSGCKPGFNHAVRRRFTDVEQPGKSGFAKPVQPGCSKQPGNRGGGIDRRCNRWIGRFSSQAKSEFPGARLRS